MLSCDFQILYLMLLEAIVGMLQRRGGVLATYDTRRERRRSRTE